MPDRLAEIKNVVDFGADATGGSNSTTAIQNAVNAAISAGGGTVYFPPGSYATSAPITFNTANITLAFRGEGNASNITGTGFSGGGYVLDRHLASPSNTARIIIEKLNIQFDTTVTGGIRLGSCSSIAVRDCSPGLLTTEDSAGNSSQNFLIENCVFGGQNGNNNGGLIIGGTGAVLDCSVHNCLVGLRAYGNGFHIGGCRNENNGWAYLLGLDSSGTAQTTTGFSIIGCTTEGNWIACDFGGACSSFYLGGLFFLGHPQSNAGPNHTTGSLPVTSYTYNNGTGATSLTMASAIPSLITTGTLITPVGLNLAGLNVQQTCTAGTTGTTINFTGSAGLGSASGGGFVNMGQQYGIWVRANNASYGVFQALNSGNVMDIAGAQVDAASSRTNLIFQNCTFNQSGGAGVGFIAPSNAYTAAFQQCNVDPIWTYSQLPQSTNVLEGDLFSISDSTTNTWGANVTVGSGSDRVLVRYNGTNYTVVAK